MSETLPKVKEAGGFVLSVGLVKTVTENYAHRYEVKIMQARRDDYRRSSSRIPRHMIPQLQAGHPDSEKVPSQLYGYPEHASATHSV